MILLEIVTPDGVRLKQDVASLSAPSVDGEFGVLPGHQPLLAALKTGIVSLERDGKQERVAVGAGFVEVFEDKALLLTDRFIRKDEIDAVQARLDLKEADEALDRFEGEPGSPEHAALISRELWAAVQLELYGDPPPPIIRTFDEFKVGGREDYARTFDDEGSQVSGTLERS